ncbi:hypothetical protein BDB01DRAFT_855006 [Pilobolus umbonatus]|nr:hypothetical protein BDB01DRAFT_855006 [Pilobolus umbonatus]
MYTDLTSEINNGSPITTHFIYTHNKTDQFYRYNHQLFELRDIHDTTHIIHQMKISDIDPSKDAYFVHIQHVFIDNHLYFFVILKLYNELTSNIYLYDPTHSTVTIFALSRLVRGIVSDVFVSENINADTGDYHMVVLGTTDAALYVFRVNSHKIKSIDHHDKIHIVGPSEIIPCALARTDAKCALIKDMMVLNNSQSQSSNNVCLVVGGLNGVLDFFLCKGPMQGEPILEFRRQNIPRLPSKLPITLLKCMKSSMTDDNERLIFIRQELIGSNPTKSDIFNAYISVIKFNVKTVKCGKTIATHQLTCKHHSPAIRAHKLGDGVFEFYGYSDADDSSNQGTSSRYLKYITTIEFNLKKWEFETKLVKALSVSDYLSPKDHKDIAITSDSSCHVLAVDRLYTIKD